MRGNSQTEYNASIQNAAKFLKENNITHDRKSDTFYDLAHYISKAANELAQRRLRQYENKPYLPTDAMYSTFQTPEAKKPTKALGSVIDEFMSDPSSKRTESTQRNYRIIFRALSEFFGEDRPINSISRDDAKRLRDMLLGLPKNATKKAPNKTLAQACNLAKKNGWNIVSDSTVNMYLDKLNSIFNYALVSTPI